MGMGNGVRLQWVAIVSLGVAACVTTPSNPGIPDAMCVPRCQRDHDCDAKVDVGACVARCEHLLSPRVIYDRQDWVDSVRACAQRQACVTETDDAIAACIADARRRLQPTPAVKRYCDVAQVKDPVCRVQRSRLQDYNHCIANMQFYSDAVLANLTDCQNEPCRTHSACFFSVVGDEPINEDPNVNRQRVDRRLADAGSPTVTIEGRVITESTTPIPGATVCVYDAKVPCFVAGASGEFSLLLPAHEETGVTVSADGFAPRLVALATAGKNYSNYSLTLQPVTFRNARYAKLGLASPGPSSTAIYATARGPAGLPNNLEGVIASIDPPSGKGPYYSAPDGAPDPGATSTSSYGDSQFVDVAAGVVELTMGPADTTCVPRYGGWPSNRLNSVRVPVVAGFESWVAMTCHK